MRFTLRQIPPHSFRPRKNRGVGGDREPIFEPYEESLPLQSGFYSYAIDVDGHFRVRWGNTRSHAAMTGRTAVAGAGHFRVNRAGQVVEIFCGSSDYPIRLDGPSDRLVGYIIRAFAGHPAFNLNPKALFEFRSDRFVTFRVDAQGAEVDDIAARRALLDSEGAGETVAPPISSEQTTGFDAYVPPTPPRLYSMHHDQIISGLEDEAFQYGEPMPRLKPGDSLRVGKSNFIVDGQGFLVVGVTGHQILSGGREVGGAGHLHINDSGEVTRVEANFSGHYRPELDADYLRYIFRLITTHPLLAIAPACVYAGRRFRGMEAVAPVVTFTAEDLASDSDDLERFLESL
ncbi:MAG: hypothetical protein U0800_04070 [Isosphaeraceae bacterium]